MCILENSQEFSGERFKEHLKASPSIYEHANNTGYHTSVYNFTIVGKELQNITRTIKEALFIIVNDPSLNRNIGKYQLPHISDDVLLNTLELNIT